MTGEDAGHGLPVVPVSGNDFRSDDGRPDDGIHYHVPYRLAYRPSRRRADVGQ